MSRFENMTPRGWWQLIGFVVIGSAVMYESGPVTAGALVLLTFYCLGVTAGALEALKEANALLLEARKQMERVKASAAQTEKHARELGGLAEKLSREHDGEGSPLDA